MPGPFLFFDVGGTLLHFRPSFVDVLVSTCGEIGVSVDVASAGDAVCVAMAETGPGPHPVDVAEGRRWWHTFFSVFLGALGYGTGREALVVELWRRHQAGDWLTPAPDTVATLERLAAMGYRMGVISNWDDTLVPILERRGLLRFFEVVVASAEVGVAKPHPGIFSYAMARAGVSPPSVVHVGDDPAADIEGALAVGMTPVFLGAPWSLDGRASVATISTLGELLAVVSNSASTYERSRSA